MWKKEKHLRPKRPICVGCLPDILWNLNHHSCTTNPKTFHDNTYRSAEILKLNNGLFYYLNYKLFIYIPISCLFPHQNNHKITLNIIEKWEMFWQNESPKKDL